MSELLDYYAPFDTETGGLNAEVQDLLTFYMAIFTTDFRFVDEISLKLKPDGGRLPVAEARALAVNGIDIQKHMADPETVPYSEGKAKLAAFLAKYRRPGRYSNITPMGHNVPFDQRWTWARLMSQEEWEKYCHYGIADTKSDADFLKRCGFLPQNIGTLMSLVEHFGIPKRNAHNAKEDTLMCVDVAKAMMEFMKSKKEGGQTQDLIKLLEAE